MSQSPELLSRGSQASESPEPQNPKKRKISDDHDAESEGKPPSKRSQKLKRKKRPKSGDLYHADVDVENSINPAIGKLDASMLVDLVLRQVKKFEPELSVVELEDRRIPGENAFRAVTSVTTRLQAAALHLEEARPPGLETVK